MGGVGCADSFGGGRWTEQHVDEILVQRSGRLPSTVMELGALILTAAAVMAPPIPLSGVLIALFTIEQLTNGRRNGFDHPPDPFEDPDAGRAGIEQIGDGT